MKTQDISPRQTISYLLEEAEKEKASNGTTVKYLSLLKQIGSMYENLFKKTKSPDDLNEALNYYLECGDNYGAFVLSLIAKDKLRDGVKERIMACV